MQGRSGGEGKRGLCVDLAHSHLARHVEQLCRDDLVVQDVVHSYAEKNIDEGNRRGVLVLTGVAVVDGVGCVDEAVNEPVDNLKKNN